VERVDFADPERDNDGLAAQCRGHRL
jgi:hypothetical protein